MKLNQGKRRFAISRYKQQRIWLKNGLRSFRKANIRNY